MQYRYTPAARALTPDLVEAINKGAIRFRHPDGTLYWIKGFEVKQMDESGPYIELDTVGDNSISALEAALPIKGE